MGLGTLWPLEEFDDDDRIKVLPLEEAIGLDERLRIAFVSIVGHTPLDVIGATSRRRSPWHKEGYYLAVFNSIGGRLTNPPEINLGAIGLEGTSWHFFTVYRPNCLVKVESGHTYIQLDPNNPFFFISVVAGNPVIAQYTRNQIFRETCQLYGVNPATSGNLPEAILDIMRLSAEGGPNMAVAFQETLAAKLISELLSTSPESEVN